MFGWVAMGERKKWGIKVLNWMFVSLNNGWLESRDWSRRKNGLCFQRKRSLYLEIASFLLLFERKFLHHHLNNVSKGKMHHVQIFSYCCQLFGKRGTVHGKRNVISSVENMGKCQNRIAFFQTGSRSFLVQCNFSDFSPGRSDAILLQFAWWVETGETSWRFSSTSPFPTRSYTWEILQKTALKYPSLVISKLLNIYTEKDLHWDRVIWGQWWKLNTDPLSEY